ncbi:uncharacterized protein [Triticum aestivum]|uniref:uncharacterized protein isoform X1 n=1 Tax=Triticum aestivum TaxID=4565 RepID=UPI001D0200E2|nr:uncharacterized protein LOC123184144 isoform X1 [Triticum aestivum]
MPPPPPPPRSLKRRRSIRYIDGNQALATDPFAGAEQSSRSRRRGPKGGAAAIVAGLRVAIGTPLPRSAFAFVRQRRRKAAGRGSAQRPGRHPPSRAHRLARSTRGLPMGASAAATRDLRLGRDNPSTPVAGEISLPRSSRSQFIRSSLTRGSERCYCRARARTWGGRLRAGPGPLSFVVHGLRTTPLSGTSAPKCPLLDLQQICYLLSSVAEQYDTMHIGPLYWQLSFKIEGRHSCGPAQCSRRYG